MGYNGLMSTTNLPILYNKRECGSCTKCCEGWLIGDVRGHKMSPGNPCFFVEQDVGCKDYENRPNSPCKTFSCGWKEIIDMPEDFYPLKSGVIIDINTINNLKFLRVVPAPNDPDINMLTWAIKYSYSNNLGLYWGINKSFYWVGSIEFCNAMNEDHGIQ
jgi:hypothetical protein